MKKVLFLSIPYALEGLEHGKDVLNGSTAIAEMLVKAISEFAAVTVVTDRADRFYGHCVENIFYEIPMRANNFEEFWRWEFRVFGAPSASDFSRDSLYRVFQLANAVDSKRLDAVLAETDFDVVVLNRQEHFFLSRHPALEGREVVFFTHDSHYKRKRSYEESYQSRQLLTHVERAIESAFVEEARKLVVISADEYDHFSSLSAETDIILFRPTISIPFRLAVVTENSPVKYYFIGVNNFVNRQTLTSAIEYFSKNGRPNIDEFHVFGSVCNSPEATSLNSGYSFHGHVDDLQAAVSEMHVLLAPIHSGSGIPLKVAEALSAGHLVLSSSFGAASYAEFIGSRIIISDGFDCSGLKALCTSLSTYAPYEEYASRNQLAAQRIVGVK